jgi:D-alanyl-D-alanine carboxypeptidase (penicillin-binding protein 5/6)
MARKVFFVFFIICLLPANISFSASAVRPLPAAPQPEISAEAAVLLDWNSGRILYARNPHLPKHMASTTKIMTAIIALERGNMDEEVITSPRAANTGGSSIWLEEGEVKTLQELLFGLMLRSGNDAAVAIAEHIAGDLESFAELMTKRARELGAKNSSFRNPHGLHDPKHYTTAYDLALISSHAMGLKEFRNIISTPSVTISWPGHPWSRYLYNQNKLFDLYEGAEGIKTGWTTPAGRCFVGAAERGGRRLISVVLNAPQMWEDTISLLDYGYNCFSNVNLVKEGQYLKSVAVAGGATQKVEAVAGGKYFYPLQPLEEDKITYRFVLNEPLKAPLKKGERIGELEVYFEQELTGVVDLLAGSEVPKISLWRQLISFLGKGRMMW